MRNDWASTGQGGSAPAHPPPSPYPPSAQLQPLCGRPQVWRLFGHHDALHSCSWRPALALTGAPCDGPIHQQRHAPTHRLCHRRQHVHGGGGKVELAAAVVGQDDAVDAQLHGAASIVGGQNALRRGRAGAEAGLGASKRPVTTAVQGGQGRQCRESQPSAAGLRHAAYSLQTTRQREQIARHGGPP